MSSLKIYPFLLFLSLLLSGSPVPAAEQPSGSGEPTPAAAETSPSLPELAPVTVVGHPEDNLSGKTELAGETLRSLPQKNNSLTETITILPRVQIGEEQRTSENAGEILPPLISISGGRAYENYFSVDGVGQNSLIDPLADNPNALDEIPGHPQRSFLHQNLIESVTVYDSNIPASYGRFTGGVIDARTRQPSGEFGGKVRFRTTRDAWTEFHIDQDEREAFDNSNSFSQQPRFTKYDGGLELDIPINDRSALLGAYQRIESDLELSHFEEWQTKAKTLETFFLKYLWTPASPYALELTAMHTPSEEEFFFTDTRESDFTIDRGGYSVNAILSRELSAGSYELTAAYQENRNQREAPADFYAWRNTPSRNWGADVGVSRSREGGFGDIHNAEKSFQLRLDLHSEPISTRNLTHTLNYGLAYTWDYGQYDRKETSYVHNLATLSEDVICAEGDPACVDGEQYFGNRNAYRAQTEDASIHHYAAYVEDLVTIGSVDLRPGLRITHDDFMDNTDVAYRLAGSWDLFKNGQSVLVGGCNRYYGEALLTYKLREAILPYIRETRVLDPESFQLSDWAYASTSSSTLDKYSALDTPYSDEWTVGIIQQALGGSLELNYMERDNRDQFARERIVVPTDDGEQKFYILNNNGSSRYESVKVSWERQWQKHYLRLNYTYSDQSTSNESYDDTFDLEDLNERVWHKDEIIRKEDLPRQDYHRKQAASVVYIGKFPGGITFTNVASYFDSYEDLVYVNLSDDEKAARGIPAELNVYASRSQPDYWMFDWRLDWEKPLFREQLLTLSLEVNNVFDRKVRAGDNDDVYELGRQFWLGMSYTF